MARSRKKNPIGAWTCAESEKEDKRLANRRLRRKVKILLKNPHFVEVLPAVREVSDVWKWNKDGKTRFDPVKYPKLLRK